MSVMSNEEEGVLSAMMFGHDGKITVEDGQCDDFRRNHNNFIMLHAVEMESIGK